MRTTTHPPPSFLRLIEVHREPCTYLPTWLVLCSAGNHSGREETLGTGSKAGTETALPTAVTAASQSEGFTKPPLAGDLYTC